MNSKIPAPRDQLAGCIWLPRILAKAKLLTQGQLPPEYAERFCHPTGIDQQFLMHLGLTREDILELARLPEANVGDDFMRRIGSDHNRILRWNHIAENLGRPGYPLEGRLPVALATTYKHLSTGGRTFSTVFEMIEADEAAVS